MHIVSCKNKAARNAATLGSRIPYLPTISTQNLDISACERFSWRFSWQASYGKQAL